ncbi:hypothetical protein VNO77_15901 [Canavalia gladiata]|uniref:Syntaxin N-terminal domain-containing protein n=1 Tax=Canavalia gladiata TaxID=3824 RepID=A0AAN9LZH4_CANGL
MAKTNSPIHQYFDTSPPFIHFIYTYSPLTLVSLLPSLLFPRFILLESSISHVTVSFPLQFPICVSSLSCDIPELEAQHLEACRVLNASKKIANAKLVKDFQAILKEFQKAQHLAAERERPYTPFVQQAGLPSRHLTYETPQNNVQRVLTKC